jgi:ribosome-associated toxin RatA of RatAB toxin-antitoxin module
VLLVALSASAKGEREVTIKAVKSTVRGQGIEGIQGLTASFVVDAAPDLVIATLWDVKQFPKIFPDIEKMDVVEEATNRIDVDFQVDAVLAKVRYTLRRKYDPKRRTVRWHEIGGDLKRVRGAWKVAPVKEPGRSLVTYESFVEVGGLVPTGLYRDLAMGKVKEMAGRVRKACEDRPKVPPTPTLSRPSKG